MNNENYFSRHLYCLMYYLKVYGITNSSLWKCNLLIPSMLLLHIACLLRCLQYAGSVHTISFTCCTAVPLLTVSLLHSDTCVVAKEENLAQYCTYTLVINLYPFKILRSHQASRAYGKDAEIWLKNGWNKAESCCSLLPCQSLVWAAVQNM